MEDSAAAFHNFPWEERGILLVSSFKPLSLHAADVQVRLTGYAATVTLSLEYVNETNKLVRAIAAYPAPAPYQLQRTTLRGPIRSLTAGVYESAGLLNAVEAGSALSTKPLVDTPVIAVATQAVPWEVNPGESILMQAVYHVPIPAAHRTGEIEFALPADLIPAVQRPVDVQRHYMTFLDARSRLRHLTHAGGSVRVCVEAQLFLPLRGVVTLEKGAAAVAGVDGSGANVQVQYSSDAHFTLTYQDDLPVKSYMQQALRLRAPVAETAEPVRLHTVAAPTHGTAAAEGGATSDSAAAVAAAMAVTIAPVLGSCPSNAEVIFVMDVHSAAQAAEAAEAIMRAVESLQGTANRVNVIVCRDAHHGGPVALLPEGAVPATEVPYDAMLAFMKEEGVQSRVGPAHPRASTPVSLHSPQLPSVLHDAVAGRGVTTAVPQGYVRNVVVVSDGGSQATDAAAVAMVCDAASNSRACRVHAVALASSADRAVLETLAQTAGGRFASAARAPGAEETGGEVDDAIAAVLEAAAVPCLVDLRTNWDVTPADGGADAAAAPAPSSSSSSSALRMAANTDGSDIACIPQGTQRLVYGVFTTAPAQVALHLCGRVGERVVEYTASTGIAPAQAADGEAPDAAAAASAAGGAGSLASAPPPLVTAAAAARIGFLTHGLRATTEAETKEVTALSQGYAVPSPFTLLTDGQCTGPGGEHKPGGIVRTPSMQTAVQVDVALRTRRTVLHAAAALQSATRAA